MHRREASDSATPTRILVLGATGMLGHVLLRELSVDPRYDVVGAARRPETLRSLLPDSLVERVLAGHDMLDPSQVAKVLDEAAPQVVINAIGVIKQAPGATNKVHTTVLNGVLPHLLARECEKTGARLLHVSTDCVFAGDTGGYTESSRPDPVDFYGLSKQIGEAADPALVLRTSVIGHEVQSNRSLVDWFLASSGAVRGYTRAIYSGVTTDEFARLLRDVVIPRPDLTGLYHVASDPISKYELLKLMRNVYGWEGEITADAEFTCDRSLNAARLLQATGYRPPDWPSMIFKMQATSSDFRRARAERANN